MPTPSQEYLYNNFLFHSKGMATNFDNWSMSDLWAGAIHHLQAIWRSQRLSRSFRDQARPPYFPGFSTCRDQRSWRSFLLTSLFCWEWSTGRNVSLIVEFDSKSDEFTESLLGRKYGLNMNRLKRIGPITGILKGQQWLSSDACPFWAALLSQ